ncbi:MAG: hypothetical protein LAP87_26895 [Acidobacteriia bacterium]|nr:hypothetical protein [Terriglobia bacterium]
MEAATDRPRANALSAFLAGLEGGMLGALWMLAFMGLYAEWRLTSFWTPENLMATAFHRHAAIRDGFGAGTVSGLALYLAVYSLLGALFALAVGGRLPRARVFLTAVAFALCWYYLSFQWLWKSLLPLVSLLHVEQSTILGHVIYGAVLGQFPVRMMRGVAPPAATVAAPEPVAAEPAPPETHPEP